MAPALLEVYAEDGMTLEQLMAFTVSADHARQVQVWEAVKNSWNKEPYSIRRMLTETSVRSTDRRAVFVGVDAYEAAGGTVSRDLFQGDDGGWLEDPALLDRLVADKLQAEADVSTEIGADSLDSKLKKIKSKAANVTAKNELEEMKKQMAAKKVAAAEAAAVKKTM